MTEHPDQSGIACRACCTKIEGLGVRYGTVEVLRDVNVHFHCGELTLLIGPNGAGKTTLLRALLGEVPYAGQVQFMDHAQHNKNPCFGYVPQRLSVDPDTPVTVRDLFRLARGSRPRTRPVLDPREALKPMSADLLADRRLGELSGGEMQRVLLALAMHPQPDILLLDEPVSGVDRDGLSQFYRLVCELRRKHDLGILLVTHDVEVAAMHADRVLLLNHTIRADGPPKEILCNRDLLRQLDMEWAFVPGPLSGDRHA